jgi:exodeoxyribonuclease VII small subunit
MPEPRRETPDFEARLQRLDEIVRELESGQVSLDRAMTLFEEGLQVGGACRALLDEAQVRVEKLLERADGHAATPPSELLE